MKELDEGFWSGLVEKAKDRIVRGLGPGGPVVVSPEVRLEDEFVVPDAGLYAPAPIIEYKDRDKYMQEAANDRIAHSIDMANKRVDPSWPGGPSCIYTYTDNFNTYDGNGKLVGDDHRVASNVVFSADPGKYGFMEVPKENLQAGDAYQFVGYPHNNKSAGYRPFHMTTFMGYTENGQPILTYSNGGKGVSAMRHNKVVPWSVWRDQVGARDVNAYRYIGTPAERQEWSEKWDGLYGQHPENTANEVSQNAYGGNIRQLDEGGNEMSPVPQDMVFDDKWDDSFDSYEIYPETGLIIGNKKTGEQTVQPEFIRDESLYSTNLTGAYKDEKYDKYLFESMPSQKEPLFKLPKINPVNETNNNVVENNIVENNIIKEDVKLEGDAINGIVNIEDNQSGTAIDQYIKEWEYNNPQDIIEQSVYGETFAQREEKIDKSLERAKQLKQSNIVTPEEKQEIDSFIQEKETEKEQVIEQKNKTNTWFYNTKMKRHSKALNKSARLYEISPSEYEVRYDMIDENNKSTLLSPEDYAYLKEGHDQWRLTPEEYQDYYNSLEEKDGHFIPEYYNLKRSEFELEEAEIYSKVYNNLDIVEKKENKYDNDLDKYYDADDRLKQGSNLQVLPENFNLEKDYIDYLNQEEAKQNGFNTYDEFLKHKENQEKEMFYKQYGYKSQKQMDNDIDNKVKKITDLRNTDQYVEMPIDKSKEYSDNKNYEIVNVDVNPLGYKTSFVKDNTVSNYINDGYKELSSDSLETSNEKQDVVEYVDLNGIKHKLIKEKEIEKENETKQ